MIRGLGIDLVLVSRIESALSRFGERFASRVYTPEERRQSGGEIDFPCGTICDQGGSSEGPWNRSGGGSPLEGDRNALPGFGSA